MAKHVKLILMINSTLCYIEKDGAYLMMHRTKKKNDINHDKWIGIGGKFEETESPEECMIREAQEETGLLLDSPEYRGIITFVSDGNYTEYVHLFHAADFSGTLKECDEGKLEWVSISKMNELPHWKGDEIFLDLLQKDVPFFSLKLEYENGSLTCAKLNGKKITDFKFW